MSKNPIKPVLINIYEDPGLQYLNQKPEYFNLPGNTKQTSTAAPVYEQINQVITNVINVAMPNGTNNEVQFNDSGELSGDNEFKYDPAADTLTVTHITANSVTLGDVTASHIQGGSTGDVLKTDGTGNLRFEAIFPSVSGNSGKVLKTDGITQVWGAVNYNDLTNTPSFATQTYVNNAIGDLINGAPAALNTLNELANALGNNASFASTITNSLANKAEESALSSVAFTGSYDDLTNTPTIPSLTGYATETFVTTRGYLTSSDIATTLTNYATESYVNGRGFITSGTLNGYGYITSGSLSTTLSDYAHTSDIPTDINQLADADGLLSMSGSADRLTNGDFEVVLDDSGNVVTSGNINIGNLALISVSEGSVITSNNSMDIDVFTNGGIDSYSEVWLHHGANVEITTNGGEFSWNFTTTGNLVFPQITSSPAPTTSGILFSDGTFQYTAASGLVGADGASAYDIAVTNGFEGTEQEWLDSLVGAPGTPGQPGNNGAPGQGFNFRGAYTSGTIYTSYDVVTYQGSTYICIATAAIGTHSNPSVDTSKFSLVASKGADGANGTNGDNGLGFNFAGQWDYNSPGYNAGDVVRTDSGDLYIALQYVPQSAVGIDNNSYWSLFMPHGADGTNGENGNDGAPGQGVPTGGTTGQILAKVDGTDYNTEWVNAPTGGGSSYDQDLNTTSTPQFAGLTLTSGQLQFPDYVKQTSAGSVNCQPNVDTVIYTSTDQWQHTFKLLLKVEGTEVTGQSWDTQSCEMMVAKSFRNDTIAGSVYGLVYTSANPLATFSTRWNATSNRVEILCRPASTTENVVVRSFVTEITTSD